MIIRKPYAFLIRNFRLIHGCLLAMIVYLTVKMFDIYSFFSGYVNAGTFTNSPTLASNYVGILPFVFLILSIGIALVIYFILSMKKKEDKKYLYLVFYYIFMIVYFVYMSAVFTSLQTSFMDVESVRLLRDLSVLFFIPQLLFLGIIFSRTLGFNLKQFDFQKDLEELQIDKEDYEEVEVTLGNNNYKILRYIRKMARLTKYFIFENKLFVIFCTSACLVVACLSVVVDFQEYETGFNENELIIANGLRYTVKQTYVTTTDMSNNLIESGKHYILINMSVNNTTSIDKKLDRDTFRLDVNGENRVPIFSMGNKFIDINKSFNELKLVSGNDSEFIVVFEVDDKELKTDYMFRIKNVDTYTSDVDEYKSVIVKPFSLNKIENVEALNLPADIKLDKTVLKKSGLLVGEYKIDYKFMEKYNLCIVNVCNENTHVVIPERTSNSDLVVLRLKTTFDLDDSLYINRYIKDAGDLLGYYGILEYRVHGINRNARLVKIKADPLSEKYTYFQVPADIMEADIIKINLLIRGKKYTINLK